MLLLIRCLIVVRVAHNSIIIRFEMYRLRKISLGQRVVKSYERTRRFDAVATTLRRIFSSALMYFQPNDMFV